MRYIAALILITIIFCSFIHQKGYFGIKITYYLNSKIVLCDSSQSFEESFKSDKPAGDNTGYYNDRPITYDKITYTVCWVNIKKLKP
jgi:hypothetical protein